MIAALTVTVMLVPQGMAYAMLAGLPPVYGLYASFIPLLIYPLFGSSRHLSVGPVALVSIIMLSGLTRITEPGSAEYIQLALLTALVAGFIQFTLALLRMGWLVNYLSEPVLVGFTSAAAIIIIVSQLGSMLGLDIARETNTVYVLRNIIMGLPYTNLIAFSVGLGSLIMIIILRRIKRTIPASLIAVILGSLLVYFLHLENKGVDIVGQVPSGLPGFTFSFIRIENVLEVLPLALIICLISFIESLAIAKTLASRQEEFHIDSNKELLGLGIAKIIGSFFKAYPTTGSFSRSAINAQSGATTGLSSVFTAILIGLTLLFFTPLFEFLPKPVLAAIIIFTVTSLINFSYARKLIKLDNREFYILLITFALTLILGVQKGVFAGVILSVILVLYKSSKPHYAVLGRLPGTNIYRNMKRFKEAAPQNNTLIIRYDDDLYFGNAEHFYDAVLGEVKKMKSLNKVVLDCSSINNIDSTALQKLELLVKTMQHRNIRLTVSGIIGPLRDLLTRSGFFALIGMQNNYFTIQDAVDDIHTEDELKANTPPNPLKVNI